MEWLESIRTAIRYIEEHLEDDISAQDVADQVHLSPFFLQRGFSMMTGYRMMEYVRNRRLYQAALELKETDCRVIDLALRYGYDTPESFSKAFTRFHHASPSHVRNGADVNVFLPLRIAVAVHGGDQMEFKIAPMFPFRLIGFQKVFDEETSYQEIPKFWDEIIEKYADHVYEGHEPANLYKKAVMENGIGEYGVCINDLGNGKFRYLIAGRYAGGEVPEGMVLYEFERCEWAVFSCYGPLPQAMQSVNTRIFKEWLPGNPDYELCGNANVEWYDIIGKPSDSDYRSAIWVPVKQKA